MSRQAPFSDFLLADWINAYTRSVLCRNKNTPPPRLALGCSQRICAAETQQTTTCQLQSFVCIKTPHTMDNPRDKNNISGEDGDDEQTKLRKEILSVQRDETLTAQEKAQRIQVNTPPPSKHFLLIRSLLVLFWHPLLQKLMMRNYNKSKREENKQDLSEIRAPTYYVCIHPSMHIPLSVNGERPLASTPPQRASPPGHYYMARLSPSYFLCFSFSQ